MWFGEAAVYYSVLTTRLHLASLLSDTWGPPAFLEDDKIKESMNTIGLFLPHTGLILTADKMLRIFSWISFHVPLLFWIFLAPLRNHAVRLDLALCDVVCGFFFLCVCSRTLTLPAI